MIFTIVLQIILYPGAPVKWTQCANLPIDGTHSSQAVVVKSKVYVGGGETAMFSSFSLIYVYDFFGDSWKAIQGPTMFSALAAYEERLVLVGGKDATTFKASNQLWVLEEDEQTWTQPLPAMTTPTVWASVASFDNHLIVAGSQEDKMEIFDGKQWTVTSSLPEACHGVVSSTVHKGHFYLMHYNRRVVFYASLESLIKQVKNGKRQSLWNTLQSAPYIGCSIGSFGGSLVAVGGSGKNDSFHMYDPLNQSWVLVGKMSIGTRYSCTTTLPNGDLLVVMGDDATVKGATWSPLVYKASLQSH